MKSGRIKRQYVWAKTGGFCWYCGARLYLREDADTELKKRLVFTVDHLHPRVHGGRGRANKVPACKYCNSHKSWRSVEQFREWVRTRLSGQAKNTVPRGWRINAEGVIFYFELAVLGRAEVQGARAEETSDVIRNVKIHRHRTSVRLEPQMWDSMIEICRREFCTPDDVCS